MVYKVSLERDIYKQSHRATFKQVLPRCKLTAFSYAYLYTHTHTHVRTHTDTQNMHALLPLFIHTKRNGKEGDVTFCFADITCLSTDRNEHHKTSAPSTPAPLAYLYIRRRALGDKQPYQASYSSFPGERPPTSRCTKQQFYPECQREATRTQP